MAETTFGRMKTLVESGAVSKQEFDQAQSDVAAKQAQVELLQAQTSDATISAPFDGVIGERKVSIGQVVDKNMVLTIIIDQDPMKVDFHVPERYISRLAEGQSIEMIVAGYPDEKFHGEVYFVDPQVDDVSRTILVKAKAANPDGKLRRGMFAKIDLVIETKENALLIPETALILKSDDAFVFTVDKDNKAQMVPVKTGLRQAGKVEVVEGLKAGDTVITEGFQKVGPGSSVAVTDPNAPKQEEASKFK
jgi:membrane fusion protein, multidrug efflux system